MFFFVVFFNDYNLSKFELVFFQIHFLISQHICEQQQKMTNCWSDSPFEHRTRKMSISTLCPNTWTKFLSIMGPRANMFQPKLLPIWCCECETHCILTRLAKFPARIWNSIRRWLWMTFWPNLRAKKNGNQKFDLMALKCRKVSTLKIWK